MNCVISVISPATPWAILLFVCGHVDLNLKQSDGFESSPSELVQCPPATGRVIAALNALIDR